MINRTLFERDGVWHFEGKVLGIGNQILIDGVAWKVLGVGRSGREGSAPFIWIGNEYYGTTVYAPDRADIKPRLQAQLRREPIGYRMTAA